MTVAPQTDALVLCKGFNVKNAPATDSRGRIRDFKPYITVRGQRLASAPIKGCLTTGFGGNNRLKDQPNRRHDGIDIAPGEKAPVGAAGDGVIVKVASSRGYGRYIDIKHGRRGVVTRYAHLSSTAKGLKEGHRVAVGEVIGKAGRTGNATGIHLHYEIIVDGKPIDPLRY